MKKTSFLPNEHSCQLQKLTILPQKIYQDVSISVSVLTLTAISIDRYYAVCYPLKFKSSLNQAKRIIVLIWIVSLILMAPDLIYLSAKYSQELSEAGLDTVLYSDCNYDWSEESSRIFQFVKTILLYLLPFILMLCAHYKIMLTLRAASQSAHDDKLEVNQEGVQLQELERVDEENFSGNIQEKEKDVERGMEIKTETENDKEEETFYRRGGQKVNKPSTFRGTNRHFPSISMVSVQASQRNKYEQIQSIWSTSLLKKFANF